MNNSYNNKDFPITMKPNIIVEYTNKNLIKKWVLDNDDSFKILKRFYKYANKEYTNFIDIEEEDINVKLSYTIGVNYWDFIYNVDIPDYISKHIIKSFNINKKLIPEQRKELINELYEKWGIPPELDSRPIFKKGGIHYWDSWNSIQQLN